MVPETFRTMYVRGMAKTEADDLSRNKETERFLIPSIVSRIFEIFGTPQIDLSAPQRTYRLHQYMPLDRADKNVIAAVDVLSQ